MSIWGVLHMNFEFSWWYSKIWEKARRLIANNFINYQKFWSALFDLPDSFKKLSRSDQDKIQKFPEHKKDTNLSHIETHLVMTSFSIFKLITYWSFPDKILATYVGILSAFFPLLGYILNPIWPLLTAI